MSIFNNRKGGKDHTAGQDEDADGLPDMQAEPSTLADAMQAQHNPKDFRAREKAAAAATTAAENEGLPSVNRRRGGNKLVTAFGFVFILGAAAALIVAVNSDKEPKAKKNQAQERVTNNLPAITIPSPPPPIPVAYAAPVSNKVPAINPGPTNAQPITVHASPKQGGKEPLHWSDRKMGGALLVAQTN
jgi:type IV secretion system protein VirB10